MKKQLILVITIFSIYLLSSCSKSDSAVATFVAPEGKWDGTFTFGATGSGTTHAFSLTLKSTGAVDVIGHNNTGPDTGSGTWVKVADSIQATFTYAASSAVYKLSGKYSSNSKIMAGTIGLNPATTGVGIFTVTKND